MATGEFLFRCLDGFQPAIPTALFRKHRAYLAFANQSGKKWRLTNSKQAQTINPWPFYLIWDDPSAGKADSTISGEFWPYQIVEIDLIDFSKRYPHIAPPSEARHWCSEDFNFFERHACRAIRSMVTAATKPPSSTTPLALRVHDTGVAGTMDPRSSQCPLQHSMRPWQTANKQRPSLHTFKR